MAEPPSNPADTVHYRGLLRDFTDALGQQLFFWGRDVIHPDGNLLCEYGMDRRKSEGIDATSCYQIPFEGDTIELHGACVGRYSKTNPGLIYIRNRRRCFLFHGDSPAIPGFYNSDQLSGGPIIDLYHESVKFLRWWLEYEAWIATATAPGYREHCYRKYRKLPDPRLWLTPTLGQRWLEKFAFEPIENVQRAKAWKKQNLEATL